MSNKHFPGLPPETVQLLDQEARRLAHALAPTCQQVDNFRLTGANLIMTKWGPVSYVLQMKAREQFGVGEITVKVPVPYRYMLMGVQSPKATVDALAQLPLVLRYVAILLGAPDNDQLTRFDNDLETEDGALGQGAVSAAGGTAAAMKTAAGVTTVHSKSAVLKGKLARSITFSWPAKGLTP